MGKKILIVDDDALVRKMVTMTLEFKDYDVIFAVDGADGLKKIEENNNIDLAIIDLIMPNVDGFGLIEKMKADDKYKSIPIAILTTEGQEPNRDKGLALGANTFLVKPFESEDFLNQVENLMKKVA